MENKQNGFFQGQWLINYNEQEYSFQQVWIFLQQVDQWLQSQDHVYGKKIILFKKGANANVGQFVKGPGEAEYNLVLTLKDANSITLIKQKTYDPGPRIDISSPINRVSLVMPFLSSDPRWHQLELTSSALFLGSALANRKFTVSAHKLNLPLQPDMPIIGWSGDLIGFTLMEDLLPYCLDLLEQAPWAGGGPDLPMLAAGGPLVTLNPLPAVFHLPSINLFLRGEGEMVFPDLLQAIKSNDLDELWRHKGFLFQKKGTIILSDFDHINRPTAFENFSFNLDFFEDDQMTHGMEVNLSRGCSRSCLFCCQVQGNRVRKLPLANVEQLLDGWQRRVDKNNIVTPGAKTININDDDLLQDTEYAGKVFKLLKRYGYRLWGVQTSLNSFYNQGEGVVNPALELIDDPALFVEDNPLVWIGTDVFLTQRAKRLGKGLFQTEALEALLEEFEKRKILNYHYWISSDHLSSWTEFFEEFLLIYRLLQRFQYFSLLPHAPFAIPYSTTPLYRLLQKSEQFNKKIHHKKILHVPLASLQLPLVERVETVWPNLNLLLANESQAAGRGFFDSIKGEDYVSAFKTVYGFLKQDRLLMESEGEGNGIESLKILEEKLENTIGGMVVGQSK